MKNRNYFIAIGLVVVTLIAILVFLKIWPGNSEALLIADKPVSITTTPSPYSFVNPTGKILYVTEERKIYVANADGSNGQLITLNVDTSNPAPVMNVSLSPDAEQVAYVVDGYIYIRDILTGQERKINNEQMGGAFSGMQWSPSGEKIGFDCYIHLVSEICVLDINSGLVETFTDSVKLGGTVTDGAFFGGWSKDESKIGFCLKVASESSGYPHSTLYWLDTRTREPNKILDESNIDGILAVSCEAISPEGDRVLFHFLSQDRTEHIFSVDINGNNLKEVLLNDNTNLGSHLSMPVVFSPDGNSYFVSYCNSQLAMVICNPVILSNDGRLLYQLSLTGVTIKSWVSGSR